MPVNSKVEVFDADARKNGGYVYTTSEQLSSRMATKRTFDVILETGCFAGKNVLDMGCGDGIFTIKFFDWGKPKSMTGMDAASQAIQSAEKRKENRPIEFCVGDAHLLPWEENQFDLVMLQSVLHHDDHPSDMIREAFRLAPKILIHEPNGNNLGLKMIEKVSPYHRAHGEKSYTSSQFNQWITDNGGKQTYQKFAGFVPMFCPDWIAKFMKLIEPLIEMLPFIRDLVCSVTVIVAEKVE
jgi:ubiquinone/menaquinone biosynthesis C-methylase UbiE